MNYKKAMFVFLVGSLVLLFFGAGPGRQYWLLWYPRLFSMAIGIAGSFTIYISGMSVVKTFFYKSFDNLFILLCLSVGTFIFPLFLLILGSNGMLNQLVCLVTIVSTNLIFWREWVKITRHLTSQGFPAIPKPFLALLIAIVVVNGLHSFVPPIDYDVLEYHLGIPAEYHKKGHIFFLPNHMYSNFPQNMEVIAFFYMQLCGKLFGVVSAKTTLLIYSFALFLGTYQLSLEFMEPKESLLSAFLVYALPWTSELARIYYVEIPQAFLLIVCLLLLVSRNIKKNKSLFFLSGLILGTCTGIKYTGLFLGLISIFPLLLFLKCPIKQKSTFIGLFLIGFATGFLPWGIRNYIHTSNPIYPLFNRILVPNAWTELMYIRFLNAHNALNTNIPEIGRSMAEAFLIGRNMSLLHLLLTFPALVIFFRKFKSLACFTGVWLILWIFFTHRIERFIYLPFILLCLPMGSVLSQFLSPFKNRGKQALVALVVILTFYHHLSLTAPKVYDYLIGLQTADELLKENLLTYETDEFVNQNIKQPVLMVGEARTFYLDVSVECSTVFDENWLETLFNQHELSDISNILKNKNLRFLYFNWNEIERLKKTYGFYYQGNRYSGFLWLDERKLDYFLRHYCERIYVREIFQKADIEIYCLK